MISLISKSNVKHLLRYRKIMEGPALKRNSSYDYWVYRSVPKPAPRVQHISADILGGFTWWWIFIHMWYQFDHLIGEFPYPESKKWSDNELGIPPVELD